MVDVAGSSSGGKLCIENTIKQSCSVISLQQTPVCIYVHNKKLRSCLCLPWQVAEYNSSKERQSCSWGASTPLCSAERILQKISSSLAQLVRRGVSTWGASWISSHWKLSSLVNNVMLSWSEQTAKSGHNRRLVSEAVLQQLVFLCFTREWLVRSTSW